MNTNINDILVEWAYRVKDGKPNPKSIGDRIVLESILKDFGWDIVQRDELLKNLTEAPENKPLSKDDKKKMKDLGLVWKGKGYGKENEEGILYKNVDGELVAVDKKGDEKEDDAGKVDKKSDFERDTPSNQGASADFQRDGGKSASDSAKNVEVKQQAPSNIQKDENGRIEVIDGKDKRLKKSDTGNSQTYTEELGSPTDEEFDSKTPDENKMGHPNEPVPNPKTDLDNDEKMKKILKAVGSPPYKFPKKYLKLISRMMNSHGTSAAVTKLTNYIKGGGAGQINSQAGELLTVIGSSLPPKEREEFFNLIEEQLDAQMDPNGNPPTAPTDKEFEEIYNEPDAAKRLRKLQELQDKYPHLKIETAATKKRIKNGQQLTGTNKNWKVQNNLIVNHGWLEAAKKNNEAIDKYIKKKYPPPCTVENSAWDTKEDFESLGNDNYEKNKGGSSDQYLKVSCEDGPHLVEISLKKDGNIRLTNSSPSKLFDYPNLTDEEKKQFEDATENDDTMEDVDGDGKITVADVSEAEFNKRMDERYVDYMKDEDKFNELVKLINEGKISPASELKIPKPYPPLSEEGIARLRQLQQGKGDSRKRNKMVMDFINATENEEWREDGKGVIEDTLEDSKTTQRNIVNAMKHEPLKSKLLDNIREKLPLKSLFENEEMMALDDISFDDDVMKECFGVDNWNELKEGLEVDDSTDPPSIVYRLDKEGEEAREIRIASINVRQDGQGYGRIRLDMDLESDFENQMRDCDSKVHGGGD